MADWVEGFFVVLLIVLIDKQTQINHDKCNTSNKTKQEENGVVELKREA
jgi:hypothetical protein